MNLDYQITLQKFTMDIGNQLADLQNMNPSNILPKLQSITNSGMEPYIIDTIRTCIQHYQKDRTLIKYAYLIDKLLKLPLWNQIIQNVIVEFYCDIFIFLLLQKCYHEIDQLKILRKFWLKTIHPKHLQTMKDIILAQTTVDVDQYFKPQLISTLKTHYEKKLKLTPEEMNFHLPKTFKTSNQIYETKFLKHSPQESALNNANYFITPHVNPTNVANIPQIYNPNIINPIKPNPYLTPSHFPIPVPRSLSPDPIPVPIQINQPSYTPIVRTNIYQPHIPNVDPYRMNVNVPQRISPPLDPRRFMDPRLTPQQKSIVREQHVKIPFYPEKKEPVNENFKRERFFSDQTRTPYSSQTLNNQFVMRSQNQAFTKMYYQPDPQPQKKIHFDDVHEFLQKQPKKTEKEQERQKYTKILQMLRNDMIFRCKQCGKGQKSGAEYQRHMNEHFEEKLDRREKRKHGVFLMNIDEWTKRVSRSSLQQFNQFYISIRNLTSSQQNLTIQPLQFSCKLCNQSFDVKLIKDQWVLSNATFCLIDDKKVPLHKTCQQALDDSSNSYF